MVHFFLKLGFFPLFLSLFLGVISVDKVSAAYDFTDCDVGWDVTGYHLPQEVDFEGDTEFYEIWTATNSELLEVREGKSSFLEVVKVDGAGRTILGDVVGWWSGEFHPQADPPHTASEVPIHIGSTAVDTSHIPHGTKFIIPTLHDPWNNMVFSAEDTGPGINDKHVDVWTGEGLLSKEETFRMTSSDNELCMGHDTGFELVDLGISHSVNNTLPLENENLEFTILVKNHGPGFLTGLAIKNYLPEQISYLNYTSTKGSFSNSTGLWAISGMNPGSVEELKIISKVKNGTLNQILEGSSILVMSVHEDYKEGNNFDSSTFLISQEPPGVAEGMCITPPMLGNWILLDSCILDMNVEVNGNMEIYNDSEIIISSNSSVSIDLTQYKILITDGSSIVISSGSSIN